MEKILKYLAEQNRSFDPKDALSKLVNETLNSVDDELGEDDLVFVQAARGQTAHKPADQRKETDAT